MIEQRKKREETFGEFSSTVTKVFKKFEKEDKVHKRFSDNCMLSICPGGRTGGLNKRMVEIFYGFRTLRVDKRAKGFDVETQRVDETGVTLQFQMNDHGYVAVMLYPATTTYTKPIETVIFVENYLDPQKLLDEVYLRKLWGYFTSYMEYTSVDGYPTRIERYRCYYLRHFKNLVVDGKYLPTKFSVYLKSLGNYILTVGLSGFIIFLFTILPQNCSDKSNEIEHIKELKLIREDVSQMKQLFELRKQEQDKGISNFRNDSIIQTDSSNISQMEIAKEVP